MDGTGIAPQAPPFKCALTFKHPWPPTISTLFENSREKALAFPRLNSMYRQVTGIEDNRSFFEKSLARLGLEYQVSDLDRARLPRRGPVVVVANHPFGGLEGLILADLLLKIRPDVKIMANHLLARIPELRDTLIFVDPFGGREAALKNLRGLREALAWLREGKMLGIFPAGAVAHWQMKKRTVTDPEWKEMAAALIRKTGATVNPVFFRGRNSARFQVLGLIHPRVRTALLPHELLNKMNSRIDVRIGQALPFKKVEQFSDDRSLIGYLRQRTYLLGRRLPVATGSAEKRPTPRRRKWKPLVVPTVPNFIFDEVVHLPDSQVLLEQEEYRVFWARAAQIPYTLREIGRLREVTSFSIQNKNLKNFRLIRSTGTRRLEPGLRFAL